MNAEIVNGFSVLKEFDVRGTFFILTWNALRHPELVHEIAEAGHEIATHGHTHRLVYEQGRERFEEDLLQSLEILRAVPGVEVLGYRAPSFSVTAESLWALEVMLEAGLTYDSSVFPVQDPLYGIPSGRGCLFAAPTLQIHAVGHASRAYGKPTCGRVSPPLGN